MPLEVRHLMPDGTLVPELMTAAEVAKYLRIDRAPRAQRVLNHLLSTRRLKPTRIGRFNLFRLEHVLEYLDNLAKESA